MMSTAPRLHLFDHLKYLYVGSQDPDADIAHWRSLGIEPEWDYRDFGTRVAGFRIATALPLVYTLDDALRVVGRDELADGWSSRMRRFINKHKPGTRISWI